MSQERTEAGIPEIEPCKHMQERVSALADGSLTGAASWYTRWHVFHCSRCGTAYRALRALLERVRSLKNGAPPAAQSSTLSAERRAQLMAAMERADNKPREPNERD